MSGWDNSKCICRHPDARTCFESRYPHEEERDPLQECECACHYDGEDGDFWEQAEEEYRRQRHARLNVDVADSQGNRVQAWVTCDPALPQKKPEAWAALQRMMQLVAEEVEKEMKP